MKILHICIYEYIYLFQLYTIYTTPSPPLYFQLPFSRYRFYIHLQHFLTFTQTTHTHIIQRSLLQSSPLPHSHLSFYNHHHSNLPATLKPSHITTTYTSSYSLTIKYKHNIHNIYAYSFHLPFFISQHTKFLCFVFK